MNMNFKKGKAKKDNDIEEIKDINSDIVNEDDAIIEKEDFKDSISKKSYAEFADEQRKKGSLMYSSSFGRDIIIIWKPITSGEFKEITSVISNENDEAKRDKLFTDKSVIAVFVDYEQASFDSVAESRAGIVPRLADEILSESGFKCVTKRF